MKPESLPSTRNYGFTLYYCDDSGSPNDGYVVYSWVEVSADQWSSVLQSWLEQRKVLYALYGVPPSEEIHATALIGGRGTPSLNAKFNKSKQLRRELVRNALAAIGLIDGIRIGTVYRCTSERGRNYHQIKADVYSELLQYWDNQCAQERRFALVYMDGDGTDKSYLDIHRRLNLCTRRIIEDPHHQHSHISQWVQMADLIAWTAYQSLRQHNKKRFAWDWYDRYIANSKPDSLMLEV